MAHHREKHRVDRTGWLRAAVLGANDGIVTTASLLVGVTASNADRDTVLIAGLAGLAAGALSMAAGEYVSVASQRDTEHADLARERRELEEHPDLELQELAGIYENRGLEPALARRVAEQMTARDALAAHARDELGITEELRARPFQAAWASGASFAVGGTLPLIPALASGPDISIPLVATATLGCLGLLGFLGARTGGAPPLRPMLRVIAGGAIAMALTAVVGRLFGAAI
jgi:VIT1/CCC1 family predicted Fe2+/Mn2+ transporter